MPNNTHNFKYLSDCSYLEYTPFTVTGELHVRSETEEVVIDFSANYVAESYEDYDGEITTEFGELFDIEMEVQTAFDLDENGDPNNKINFTIDDTDRPRFESLIRDLYSTTEPDLRDLEKEYKSYMEGL